MMVDGYVALMATWRKPAVMSSNQEEELRIGRERLGSVWKLAIGDGWAYACRSDHNKREAPTREAAKAELIAALSVMP